jgi:CPA2 family monovalent cation:H+ antiporter-2
MALKATVIYGLGALFGIRGADRWLMALGLAQMGEFGFVLLAFTVGHAVLPAELADRLLLVVAVSMLLTPLVFIVYDRVIAPFYSRGQEREADAIEHHGSIIIAGHGRFGGIVNRMLRGAGYETVVLDYSSEQLEVLRAYGFEIYFGDATRPDLLHAAGIESAKLMVVTIDDREHATELCRYLSAHHPNVYVIARAIDREHVYDLYATGCRDIIRETFDSGVRTGRSAFEALGVHPFEAEQLARKFVRSDLEAITELVEDYDPDVPNHENSAYVERAAEMQERMEAEMKGEERALRQRTARGWSPPTSEDLRSVQKS